MRPRIWFLPLDEGVLLFLQLSGYDGKVDSNFIRAVKTFVFSAASTFFVSFQEFSLLLLYGIFLNINVLRKLQLFKSSISSKSFLILLSWLANFLSWSADLKFKLSISSLFCLFSVLSRFTSNVLNLLLISSSISSRLSDELSFPFYSTLRDNTVQF